MNTINSIEEFAKRYNNICIKLKENVLDKMYGQNWDLCSVKTIESDTPSLKYFILFLSIFIFNLKLKSFKIFSIIILPL